MNKAKGFTLIELMVTVAIMAIIMAMAIPSYRNMQNASALRAAISEWQDSFYFAQAEAMRLKRDITICASSNGETCTADTRFDEGWIVADCSDSQCASGDDKRNRLLRDIVPASTKGLELTFNGSNKLVVAGNGNITGNFVGRTLQATIKEGNEILAQQALVISREGRMRYSDSISATDN